MPPKVIITEEIMLQAAFDIVREQGFESLTARNIAQRLKCSTQPVYRIYENMEDVKGRVYEMAVERMQNRVFGYQNAHNSPALNMAIGFLQFAQQERNLFHYVYISGYKSFDLNQEVFLNETISIESMLHSKRFRNIDEKKRRTIFVKIAIFLIGIGTMIHSGTLKVDFEEAVDMIREMYEAQLAYEGRSQS